MESSKHCPICHVPFQEISFGEDTIERCPGCHGMFFEFDEMKHVLKNPIQEAFSEIEKWDGSPDRETILACPKCFSDMQEEEYALSGVHIDRCPSCSSIFLDGGEHTELNRYLSSLESEVVMKNEEKKIISQYEKAFVTSIRELLERATKDG